MEPVVVSKKSKRLSRSFQNTMPDEVVASSSPPTSSEGEKKKKKKKHRHDHSGSTEREKRRLSRRSSAPLVRDDTAKQQANEDEALEAEMAEYYEKRATYSCSDIDTTRPVSFVSPRQERPEPEAPLPPVDTTVVNIPVGKSTSTEASRKYRTGVLNHRRDDLPVTSSPPHCFVCLAPSDALVTLTVLTGRLTMCALGASDEKPIFREIDICDACQWGRDLANPMVVLPPESLALFRPLYDS